jgi:hypothetical protein
MTIIVLLADLRAMAMRRGLGIMVLATAISDGLRVQHTSSMAVKSLYLHQYLLTVIDVSKMVLDQDIRLIYLQFRMNLAEVLRTMIGAAKKLKTTILGPLLIQCLQLRRMLSAAEIIALGSRGARPYQRD